MRKYSSCNQELTELGLATNQKVGSSTLSGRTIFSSHTQPAPSLPLRYLTATVTVTRRHSSAANIGILSVRKLGLVRDFDWRPFAFHDSRSRFKAAR